MQPMLDRTSSKMLGLALGLAALAVCFALSVAVGTTNIRLADTIRSFIHYDASSNAQVIVRTARLPRALIALLSAPIWRRRAR